MGIHRLHLCLHSDRFGIEDEELPGVLPRENAFAFVHILQLSIKHGLEMQQGKFFTNTIELKVKSRWLAGGEAGTEPMLTLRTRVCCAHIVPRSVYIPRTHKLTFFFSSLPNPKSRAVLFIKKGSSVKLETVAFSEQMEMLGSRWSMPQTSPALEQYAAKVGYTSNALPAIIAAGNLLQGAGFTLLSGGSDHEANPVYKAELPDTGMVLYLAWYQDPANGLVSTAGHWVIGLDTGTTIATSSSTIGNGKLTLKMLPVLFLESAAAQPPDGDTLKNSGQKWFYFTVNGQGTTVKSNDANAGFVTASFSTKTTPQVTSTSTTRTTTKTTTTPYTGSPTTRTTTTTIPTTSTTATLTTTTELSCPNAPEPCCTKLGIKGRAGYNYIVNGFYDFVGIYGGKAAFNRETLGLGDITIFWASEDTRWTISDGRSKSPQQPRLCSRTLMDCIVPPS